MPSGQAHLKIGLLTSPMVIIIGWTVSGFSFDIKTWAAIGVVTGAYILNPYYLSPDMSDLPESSPSKRWGCAAPILWPLQMIIHKGGGRNPLSHWPPLSSLIRVIYLWIAIFMTGLFVVGVLDLIYYGLFEQIAIPMSWIKLAFLYWLTCWRFPWTWGLLWGIALGDLVHICSDLAYSYMKK